MRTRALAVRIIRQFIRDKRTLALLFAAPLLVLTLVHFVFNGQTVKPHIGTVQVPAPLTERLEQAGADVRSFDTAEQAEAEMRKGKLDAIVSVRGGVPSILLEGSDPSVSKASLLAIQQTVQSVAGGAGVQPAVSYMYGKESLTSFDSFGPVLIGFFSFFFVFLLAGVAFLRERTTGTLERLLATPIRRTELVAGYLSGFGLFALLQAALIAWFAVDVLGLYMEGSIWLVLLVNLLLTMTALTLGTLLSSFAGNEFQIIQFIPVVIVPQVFFSGLFNLDAMEPWLQNVSYVMPLYYGADALRGIMIRGEGLGDIWADVLVLLGFSAAFALLNVLALKKQRPI